MIELHEEDRFNITGRGLVILVKYTGEDFKIGDVVSIDSAEYEVRGIEMQRPFGDVKPKVGAPLGLLVKEVA